MKNCIGETEPTSGCARRRRIQRLLRQHLMGVFDEAPEEVLQIFYNNPAELQRQVRKIIVSTQRKLQPVIAILAEIDLNWREPIYLGKLAQKLNTSITTLCQKFKRLTGKTFVDATNEPRLQRAEQLLRHSRRPLKTIASEAGFSEYRNFVHAFRKRRGCTPSQFRGQLIVHRNAQ